MTNNIIDTFDLTKIYKLKNKQKEILALDKANISIKEGEIFGLLGPNGAGKTTIIQILTTLIQPTSGYAIIDGYNIIKKPNQAKARISLMLDWKMVYYRVTGYDNLKFFCKIYNVPDYKKKIYKMAKELGIEKWLDQYVESFSTGMRVKLALCRTLLLERKILLLDEPTLGLDVRSTSSVIDKLKNLNKTIFLTSHNMNVVEKLCNRIAFISKGKISRIGTTKKISRLMQTEIKVEIEINDYKDQLKSELYHQNFVNEVIDTNEGFIVCLKNRNSYGNLFAILSKYKILMIKEQEISLENLFVKLV